LSYDVHTTHKLLATDIGCGSDYCQKVSDSMALGSPTAHFHNHTMFKYPYVYLNIMPLIIVYRQDAAKQQPAGSAFTQRPKVAFCTL